MLFCGEVTTIPSLTKTVLIVFCLIPLFAVAGDSPREIQAVRVQIAPRIDGFLNDEAWTQSVPANDFLQRDPEEGKPASEPTEIRIVYDDEALYFGCMFFDSDPKKIVARLTRRDDEIESDRGSIRIDSYHDHQTAYAFTFNAAGVKVDILQYDDGNREDPSWDVVWDLQTQVLSDGWSAEVKIPFSVLRYKGSQGDSTMSDWGINFIRWISRKQEEDRWIFTPKRESGFVSRFGHLTGLRQLPAPGQIELLPFVVGKYSSQPANAIQDKRMESSGDAGLDLKYTLSSSLILDATVNPDFGQVEADPAVLNLSTFETFFPEKRPFFIEGTQIIRFSTFGDAFGPGMFYSRRIGRAISTDEVDIPEGGRIVSVPQNVSILGAAKISGKTSGGLSLGILEGFTRKEVATVADSSGGKAEQILEPFAHYNIVRLRQDILQNSNVGMILTTTAKTSRFPAITAGGDWNLRFQSNTYQLDGFLAFSRTTDDSSERVNGSAGKVQFSRIAAEHWLWRTEFDYTSKEYDINDVGFFFSPNDIGATGELDYKEDQPGGFYRNYGATLFLHERENFDGVNLFRQVDISAGMLLANYWNMGISGSYDAGKYDQRETRGNGEYQRPHPYSITADVETDSRENLIVKIQQLFGWDTKRKKQSHTSIDLGVRPFTWMVWNVALGYEKVRNLEAWVENVTLNDGTTGSIFADRNTEQVDLTLRGTITFTRDLTLQVYAQMFLAKGQFLHYRLLVGTSAFVPFDYGGSPDFNNQWLNTNVVLRWEYLPGSTLFLVWSQSGQGSNGTYASSFGRNFNAALSGPSANVFLAKVSYWLNF